jgi:dTDP-4-dehydrorhamnose reductase
MVSGKLSLVARLTEPRRRGTAVVRESMRLSIFGEAGQVACDLIRRAPSDVQITAISLDCADLLGPAACAAAVRESAVDAVLNATVWTSVDLTEITAMAVNNDATTVMAAAEHRVSVPHISTDYVFDGAGNTPFASDYTVDPIGAYGLSLLKGEEGIRSFGGARLILSTSCPPPPTTAIADALISAVRAVADCALGGTHHFVGAPDTNWADFARAIFKETGSPCFVKNMVTPKHPSGYRVLGCPCDVRAER